MHCLMLQLRGVAAASHACQVNQLSAYLEVSALFVLMLSLAFPSMRNILMLIVYGQSVHVRNCCCLFIASQSRKEGQVCEL